MNRCFEVILLLAKAGYSFVQIVDITQPAPTKEVNAK